MPAEYPSSPRVRDQPSLTTSTGASWLVAGGILGAVAIAFLVPMMMFPPAGAALVGLVVVVALYVGMVVARIAVPAGRLRLGLMASCMIAEAAVALGSVLVISYGAWSMAPPS